MKVGLAEDGRQAIEYIQRDAAGRRPGGHDDAGSGRARGAGARQDRGLALEVILMTAFADVDSAVAAMKAGAYHFLTKPFHSNDAVAHAVLKAAEHRRLADSSSPARAGPPLQGAIRRRSSATRRGCSMFTG